MLTINNRHVEKNVPLVSKAVRKELEEQELGLADLVGKSVYTEVQLTEIISGMTRGAACALLRAAEQVVSGH